eukprot:scaffold11648_cov126-Isochrysis_galbana.AAC.1
MERSDYLPTARLHELAAQVDPKIRLEADAEQARRCSRPLPDTAHAHPVCASGNRWEPACGFKFAEKPAGGISRWLPDAPECVRAAPFGPGTLFRRRKYPDCPRGVPPRLQPPQPRRAPAADWAGPSLIGSLSLLAAPGAGAAGCRRRLCRECAPCSCNPCA